MPAQKKNVPKGMVNPKHIKTKVMVYCGPLNHIGLPMTGKQEPVKKS